MRLTFLAIWLFGFGSVCVWSAEKPCVIDAEEAKVISDFLKSQPSASLDVVVSVTRAPMVDDVDFYNTVMAVTARGVPQAIREDFKERNKTQCRIPAIRRKNLEFLEPLDLDYFLRDRWEAFHRKFGKQACFSQFSRVGLNKDKRTALLSVDSGCGPMAGGGWLYRLDRQEKGWVITSSIQTWTT